MQQEIIALKDKRRQLRHLGGELNSTDKNRLRDLSKEMDARRREETRQKETPEQRNKRIATFHGYSYAKISKKMMDFILIVDKYFSMKHLELARVINSENDMDDEPALQLDEKKQYLNINPGKFTESLSSEELEEMVQHEIPKHIFDLDNIEYDTEGYPVSRKVKVITWTLEQPRTKPLDKPAQA